MKHRDSSAKTDVSPWHISWAAIKLAIRNALIFAANLAADEPNAPAAVHH
jgi:hypothetical protein